MKKTYMIKFLLPLILSLASVVGYGQAISIPQLNDTPESLVGTLLDNACVEVANIDLSSQQSVAYFNNNGGNFPIEEGVVIRTGDVSLTQGSYTGEGLSSQINNFSDSTLEEINEGSGQSSELTDVAFLEFEFVPLSSNFNFEFLFASNEYGEWQCVSSDVFAFLLTNLETGETENIAVIPGTNTPVSVRNIKNNAYNPSCPSDNANLFQAYNVGNEENSTLNMRGYTTVMNASSTIIPGIPYKIRLVIADSNDSDFDSAIFLAAGSFDANLDLGEDISMCGGDSYTLTTDLDANDYNHSWTYNGSVIPGLNGNSINATETGTYGVLITKDGTSCSITDEVVITELNYTTPQTLETCYTGEESYTFNLTLNDAETLALNNEDYEVHYFATEQDANNLQAIPASEIENYLSPGDETIYIRFYNTVTGTYCDATDSFELMVNEPLNIAEAPAPVHVCTTEGENPSVNLQQVNSSIVSAEEISNFNFEYYNSEADAIAGENALTNNYEISYELGFETIWVKVLPTENPDCFEVVSVDFILHDLPPVSELEDVLECESYILPEIEYGNYYDLPDGQGNQLPEGYEVTQSGRIYIFNGPDEYGCTNQSSFKVTLVKNYSVSLTHCDSFRVPNPPAGEFYTAQGGPNGDGEIIPTGSYIYENQTIWFYAEVNGEFCKEEPYDIEILPLPPVDEPANVVTCGNYTLPTLTNGNYFTVSGGGGQQLAGGQNVTQTTTFFVYNDDGTCDNEHEFTVTIVPDFEDQVACGGYELPQLPIGGFYTQAEGQGTQIPDGTYIEESQTIFYYAETTTLPNCTSNTSFYIQVKPIPPVDSLEGVVLCEGETYVLPAVTNGQFFTQSNRGGTMLQAGDVISSSQTIYINNEDNGCTNETSFEVEIRPLPEVENFTDIYTCDGYALLAIENGTYYTGSLMQGEQLFAGDIIDETQTIYIYNEYDDLQGCYNEDSFTVFVEGIQLGEVEDVYVCESYTLPPLVEGNYYTETGGEGNLLLPGQQIVDSKEIFIYAKNGSRFICESEISFNVYVGQPDLDNYQDIESCGNYSLEEIVNQEGFSLGYYWEDGAQNPLTEEEYTFDEPGTYTVYVYAESEVNPDCFDEKSIDITIYERPQLYIEGGTICRDISTGEVISPFYLISGLDPAEFEVNWYLNNQLLHTGSEYEAVEAGEYYVEVEKVNPEVGSDCNYLPTKVTVLESAKPIVRAKVTEPFEDVANIVVEIVKGYGEYEYQLDGGGFHSDREFYDVKSGPHQIVVRGLNGEGCGVTVLEVDVIKYPKFFTPNQDGINDTWNIRDLELDRNATIAIYNRFGKLITKIKTSGKGWDGSYNAANMPSNDYWFSVDYTYQGKKREFKSHFTLKR